MTFSEFIENEPASMRKQILDVLPGFPATTNVRSIAAKPGTYVLYQDNERANIFVLLTGRVSVVSTHDQYSSYDEFLPVTVFGEQEALANLEAIRADVRAKTNCRFLVIDEHDYLLWVQSSVETMQYRVSYVLGKLVQDTLQERHALYLSNNERLQSFLIDYYARHPKENQEGTVMVRTQRNIIAEEIGCSLRTVNRSVQVLAQNQQIGLHKGKITLTEEQYKKLKITVKGRQAASRMKK